MPSGTKYDAPNINSFVKDFIHFDGNGASGNVTAGQTANVDYTLTDDCLLTGLEFMNIGGAPGDYVNLQLIDPTGMTGEPPGTVLLQMATNWYVFPNNCDQYDLIYSAKIEAGLMLRMVYTSVGTANVWTAVNYKLHKCLE